MATRKNLKFKKKNSYKKRGRKTQIKKKYNKKQKNAVALLNFLVVKENKKIMENKGNFCLKNKKEALDYLLYFLVKLII